MHISEQLHCLFSARITEDGDTYTVEVPKRELDIGSLTAGETYRVALLAGAGSSQPAELKEEADVRDQSADTRADPDPVPPVEAGEERTVEIENLGDQGDGITRVDRGFVVIVPDTEQGERVRIEITDVRETVAFAEVIERISYYR